MKMIYRSDQEEWKAIDGYENLYLISNTGKVYSERTKRILKENYKEDRYYRVRLSRNGIQTKKRIHRLVAEAFIPNPLNKPFVNHIDGNRRNNHVDNLEWCTHSENMNHAVENNLLTNNMEFRLIHINTGIQYEFVSGIRASRFLKRSKSYVTDSYRLGRRIMTDSVTGDEFKVMKLGE